MPQLTDDEVKAIPCLSVNDVIELAKKKDTEKLFAVQIENIEIHLTVLALRKAEQQLTRSY